VSVLSPEPTCRRQNILSAEIDSRYFTINIPNTEIEVHQ
jgi:hypothetical protein